MCKILVMKEPSEMADLSPPAQFRTLSDNYELDEDYEEELKQVLVETVR